MDTKKGRTVKKRLSKEEFRATLPEKLNKIGEWLVNNYLEAPTDNYHDMSRAEKSAYMRAVLK